MLRRAAAALVISLLGVSVFAQRLERSGPTPEPVKQAAGETPVPGECLAREQLDLIMQLDALKRPTVIADAQKPFNPHYLVGSWRIEGDLPSSPLGAAGRVTGVETVRRVDACSYEGVLEATGPDGAFTVKSTMTYDPKAHNLVRLEQDSRGFQLLKTGAVGGDSGGYFTHYWEVPQFTYKGIKLRIKGTTFFSSPDNYRLRSQIAAGDQAFLNAGMLWWRRQDGRSQP